LARVLKTKRAERDLDEIWLYIATDDIDAADRCLDASGRRAYSMADHPHGGRSRPELAPNLRSFVVGAYVIFYIPLSDGIRIARVVHGARDIDRVFHEGDGTRGST